MSIADLIKQWTDAFNRHDSAGIAALYAPNAVVEDPFYTTPIEGRDAIQKDFEGFFRAFPDIRATTRSTIESGAAYASDGHFVGTHDGPLATESGEVPPTGRRLELKGASIARLDGQSRILEERRYYDATGLLAQLEIAS